ncbi:granulocyte-macrophage colony-stimulating factor [Erinaceus europaeus]|uniref:Granulocyte-macrophage colony-stimulating factor n=1 Tax=Erinaceus europaeus TaxID=9365 RepID=A0A1S2ZIS6_ERIEU|nr:granulocyte-macrophage colony-stimulating factor [Erinaceus europaeus]
MWLQNLLFLGTVVYSLSAPTHTASSVTQPCQNMDVIKEALSLLRHSNDTDAVLNEMVDVVSEMFDPKEPTCLQRRLELYVQGLRGSLTNTNLKGLLTIINSHYKQYSTPTPDPFCEPLNVTFKSFKENLITFLSVLPLDC